MARRTLLLWSLIVGVASAFLPPTAPLARQRAPLHRVWAVNLETLVELGHQEYLATLPDQAKTMKGAWEFVLVERMEPPTQTAGGLFLPTSEKDPLHVVRVISLGDGVVGESGVLARTEGMKPGDVALTKQPWGIGPRDDLFEQRKFSFVRAKDILARIE